MSSQKAFWLALATVGVPSILIWGASIYVIGFYKDEWTFYACFILLPVILLTPLVYRNYKRESRKPTRDDYLDSAFMTGGIAIAYSLLAFFHLKYRNGSFMSWVMPIGWTIVTLVHLRKASKASKTRYTPDE